MTPERWQRINEVLDAAWERAPEEHAAILDQECAGDPGLRSEVEALLGSDRKAGEFLSSPAVDVVKARAAVTSTEPEPHGGRAGSYKILREIGHGGMGTVYLGERADGEFRKKVAIKLVSPHLNKDVLRRFRNERQVEAALEHPNIARLLDGGTTGTGSPYLVMEYVDGVRIDAWCESRELTVRSRLELFRQVCAAVQYAHERRVIHRDIKPGNILVTADGTPKLLDFGIAKVLDPGLADSAGTTLGLAPMTLEYASPEQVRGKQVGPASDVYALGVLLYYLLTRRLPYPVEAGDLQEIARVICEQEPLKPSAAVPSADLRRELAGDLDNIILKALRKEPERRYSSAAAFSDDLGRFLRDLPVAARNESLPYRTRKMLKRNRRVTYAAAITAAAVLTAVTGVYRLASPEAVTEDGIRSLAVLPLENLSGDKEQEYFADGITDALISDLARIPALRVISRTSVMSYKGMRRPMPELARTLGVQTIAEGSVSRAGNRIRIAVRLIEASKDHSVWSGSYEGEIQNIFALQTRVAGAIASEINVTLTRPEPGRTQHRRVDLDAYDAYLKGRHIYFNAFTRDAVGKATAQFQRARELDPGYAPAYAGLAACYFLMSNVYLPPTEVMPKAKAAALKALELDNTLAEAHSMLALVSSVYDFNRAAAEAGFRRAIRLKPSDAEARLWYSQHLAGMGRFDEAIAEAEQARKLDPVSPAMNAYVGLPLYCARRYDQVIERLQPIADAHPDYHHPRAFLALAYEQKRDYGRAIAEMEKAYSLDKQPEALAQLGHIYAMAGRTADARQVLAELTRISRQRFVPAYNFAVLHAGLGEREEAFRWLQKAEEDRSEWFAAVNVDPRLDGLRPDPRFAAVLRSAGLAQ